MTVMTQPFKRGDKVISTTDLARVPEGTNGKVMVANGFTWLRYWVHFDNGVELGHINHDNLVKANQWDAFLIEREAAANAVGEVDETNGVADAGAIAATGGVGVEDVVVGGVTVPGFLLERSADARTRLSA
jgi:hypothetical protein